MTAMNAGYDRWQRIILPCGFVLLASLGCGKDAPDSIQRAAQDAAHPNPEVPGYTVDELSSIGSHLESLDEGRLCVAPPIEWHMVPRGKDYVVRFVRDRTNRSPLPRITVEAGETDWKKLGELSEANLKQFRDAVADDLEQKTRQALEEDVKPLKLGSILCVHYVVRKQYQVGGKVIRGSREVIQTLQHGRLYTVSLDVYAGKLYDYRGDAFAVMANMRFLVPEQEESAEKEPAEEGPAEESPGQQDAGGEQDEEPANKSK